MTSTVKTYEKTLFQHKFRHQFWLEKRGWRTILVSRSRCHALVTLAQNGPIAFCQDSRLLGCLKSSFSSAGPQSHTGDVGKMWTSLLTDGFEIAGFGKNPRYINVMIFHRFAENMIKHDQTWSNNIEHLIESYQQSGVQKRDNKNHCKKWSSPVPSAVSPQDSSSARTRSGSSESLALSMSPQGPPEETWGCHLKSLVLKRSLVYMYV